MSNRPRGHGSTLLSAVHTRLPGAGKGASFVPQTLPTLRQTVLKTLHILYPCLTKPPLQRHASCKGCKM